jgi:hypothetical protein
MCILEKTAFVLVKTICRGILQSVHQVLHRPQHVPNDVPYIAKVGDLDRTKQWNTQHPWSDLETTRNWKVNQVQGNRNTYADDYTLVDHAFPDSCVRITTKVVKMSVTHRQCLSPNFFPKSILLLS